MGAVALVVLLSRRRADGVRPFPHLAASLRPTAPFALFSVLVTSLIVIRHKGNIERLWNGTESKMGQGRSSWSSARGIHVCPPIALDENYVVVPCAQSGFNRATLVGYYNRFKTNARQPQLFI